MRKVYFTKLGMENFCNHIEPVEIEFGKGALWLITGPNGSGKTSLIQALPYTLYGICEKGRGEDVVNDKVMKNCHTWAEFIIDDDIFLVNRYVKYSKVGTTVTLHKNGVLLHKGHKEIVPEIEKLLVPRKLFSNTLLFGQKVKTFFTDLNDSEQKEIFRKILKLSDYILFQRETSNQLKDIEKQLLNIINSIAVNLELAKDTKAEITRLEEEEKEFYKQKLKNLQVLELSLVEYHQRAEVEENILKEYEEQKLDTLLEDINIEISVATEQIGLLQTNLDNSIDKISDQAKIKEAELVKEADKAKQEILNNLQKQKSDITKRWMKETLEFNNKIDKIDKKINEIKLNIVTLKGEIKVCEAQIDNLVIDQDFDVCPTCHQNITQDVIESLNSRIKKYESSMYELKKQIEIEEQETQKEETYKHELQLEKDKVTLLKDEEIEQITEDCNRKNTATQERLTIAIGKLKVIVKHEEDKYKNQIRDEREALENKSQVLNKKKSSIIDQIEKCNNVIKLVQQLKVDVATCQKDVENKKKEEYNKSTLVSLQIKLKGLKVELNKLKTSQKSLTNKIQLLEFWKIGFSTSGIQSMLIDDSIPFMNTRISEYMDQLSNGRYSVTFDTLKATKDGEFRDKISVDVFDNQTHADSRIKLSGGQERLVDIGTIMTLCDLQSMVQDVEFNLLLFDEIFDALDDENISYVANLIKQVSKNKWVGVISHRHIDNLDADEVLRFQ